MPYIELHCLKLPFLELRRLKLPCLELHCLELPGIALTTIAWNSLAWNCVALCCLAVPGIVFFCKVSVHILCPFLNGLVFFPVNLFEFFVNSGYQPFVRRVNCKNVFSFFWLPIHFSDFLLSCRSCGVLLGHICLFWLLLPMLLVFCS